MLGDKDVIATVATKDLAAARRFYEGTLGLAAVDTAGTEAITFASGHAKLIVYRSEYAGTNKATALNWGVGDELEAIVAELGRKGVRFENTTTSPASRGPATMPRHGSVQVSVVQGSGRQHHRPHGRLTDGPPRRRRTSSSSAQGRRACRSRRGSRRREDRRRRRSAATRAARASTRGARPRRR